MLTQTQKHWGLAKRGRPDNGKSGLKQWRAMTSNLNRLLIGRVLSPYSLQVGVSGAREMRCLILDNVGSWRSVRKIGECRETIGPDLPFPPFGYSRPMLRILDNGVEPKNALEVRPGFVSLIEKLTDQSGPAQWPYGPTSGCLFHGD